jgi:hypothetical protein
MRINDAEMKPRVKEKKLLKTTIIIPALTIIKKVFPFRALTSLLG